MPALQDIEKIVARTIDATTMNTYLRIGINIC